MKKQVKTNKFLYKLIELIKAISFRLSLRKNKIRPKKDYYRNFYERESQKYQKTHEYPAIYRISEREEIIAEVDNAINCLNNNLYVEVLLRRYTHFLSFNKIAERMHMSKGKVIRLHNEALRELCKIKIWPFWPKKNTNMWYYGIVEIYMRTGTLPSEGIRSFLIKFS